jgi:hypothetical protein
MPERGNAAPLAAVIAGVVALALMVVGWSGPPASPVPQAASTTTVPHGLPVADLHVPEEPPETVEEPEPEVDRIETSPDSRAAFEELFPAQAEATRGEGPGEDRWALLVGINEHLGTVANNYVSREDAVQLRDMLLDAGWADERIVLLTDTDATGEMIWEGLSWLARKAGEDDTVLFHYSGHSKKWYGGGGEILDIALWPTDDDFIKRDEVAEALGEVRHASLWGNFVTCNAEGFHEAGLAADGRLLTYSSRTPEKSYEDPDAGNTVYGRFLLEPTLWEVDGASEGLSVQEAFDVAAPQAHDRTVGQRYGPQTPVIYDHLGEPFRLALD